MFYFKVQSSNEEELMEEEKQEEGQYLDESQLLSLLHVFVKNLEANGVTKEQINQKIDEICKLFENRTEATKDEFIEPFIKMFIETMHITKKEDIEVVGGFLNDFVDSLNGEISVFFNGLIEVFDNVVIFFIFLGIFIIVTRVILSYFILIIFYYFYSII